MSADAGSTVDSRNREDSQSSALSTVTSDERRGSARSGPVLSRSQMNQPQTAQSFRDLDEVCIID